MYDLQLSDPIIPWPRFRHAWFAVYRLADRELSKLGLSPIKAYVLRICQEYQAGPLTPAELSRLLFRQSNSMAQLLTRMEREGLIKRVPKRPGHPFTEIKITEKGRELLRPAGEVIANVNKNVMSCLSAEELEQFDELLKKVQVKALSELHLELKSLPSGAFGDE